MLIEVLTMTGKGAVFIGIMYALIYLNKLWCDWRMRADDLDVDHAIVEESNLAAALSRGGLYLGISIGMYGVISGPSTGFLNDVLAVAGYGALVSLFFFGARLFSSTVVLRYVKNVKELKKGNCAVGFVEGGSFLATGIMAMSSMMGTGGNAFTAIGFFVIGQALLLVASFIYEVTTKWSVQKEISEGNAAAGLLFAGIAVAMAVALHGVIASDFVSWTYNLTFLLIEGCVALAFMLVLSLVVDWLFLPKTSIETEIARDKNVAAVTVVVAMKIAGALAISAAII